MINVNQITSQLAKMPDPMLQKFAAMHKNDPYTVALALSESNRRKQIRAGAQAQMAGQEAPKVVDQEVAQMLPEEVGIAQLPAKNIEGMATGGIVAFEEGGEVPRFQYGGVPQTLPGGLGIYSQGSFGPQPGEAELQARIARIEANPRIRRADKDALIAQARAEFGMPKAAGAALAAAPTVAAPPAQTTASPAPAPVAPPTLDTTQQTPPAAPSAPAPVAGAGIPSLKGYKKELEAAINKNAPTKEAFQQEFADIDKPLLDKMKAGIEKETARLKSDKEQDFYMSLIQGGLAAAAESGPNALQNIAKGLSTGAGSYKEALKDFRKATQENTKMEMEMARYESTGKKDALKSFYDAQSKRDDRYAAGLTSLMAQEMQSKSQIAAAGMPGAQERLFSALGGKGGVEAGLKKYAEVLGPEARTEGALRQKALTAWSSSAFLQTKYPNFEDYYRMAAGASPTTGGASGANTSGWGQARVINP